MGIKYLLDKIFSFILLVILSPIFILIAILIKLDSKGPVFFIQQRVGKDNKLFNIYKFRTMVPDAINIGSGVYTEENDPRITRTGRFLRKTSLDELPQFINVFKGDMSLVGTRPPTLDEVVKYNNPHHRRISFKPGITGMWQISGRSDITDFDEVVRLDTSYIDDWNIWKDIVIIFKTIYVLLFKNKGAY